MDCEPTPSQIDWYCMGYWSKIPFQPPPKPNSHTAILMSVNSAPPRCSGWRRPWDRHMRAAHQYTGILVRYLGLRRSLNRSREIDAYLVKQSPFCCTGGHLYANQSLQKLRITGLAAGSIPVDPAIPWFNRTSWFLIFHKEIRKFRQLFKPISFIEFHPVSWIFLTS